MKRALALAALLAGCPDVRNGVGLDTQVEVVFLASDMPEQELVLTVSLEDPDTVLRDHEATVFLDVEIMSVACEQEACEGSLTVAGQEAINLSSPLRSVYIGRAFEDCRRSEPCVREFPISLRLDGEDPLEVEVEVTGRLGVPFHTNRIRYEDAEAEVARAFSVSLARS